MFAQLIQASNPHILAQPQVSQSVAAILRWMIQLFRRQKLSHPSLQTVPTILPRNHNQTKAIQDDQKANILDENVMAPSWNSPFETSSAYK